MGNDPEVKTMQSGDKVANFTLAVSEKWTDKNSGERKEKTEWVRCVVFNQNIVKVLENYVSKGSKIHVEGQMETRSWEKDGVKIYTTEIMLRPFHGNIILLDSKKPEESPATSFRGAEDELEDSIPF